MHMPEIKIISKVGSELKKRIPFLSGWKIERQRQLKGRTVDMLITAYHGKMPYNFCIEIKRAGYPQYIREGIFVLDEFRAQNPLFYPIIIVPKIGEQGKRICEKHNVGYMDFSGNLKIAIGSIYIDKTGREQLKEDATSKHSIFSPKSERITKILLYQPHKKWIQKEISEKSGLSKGMVSRIVKRMVEAGYLVEQDKRLSLSDFEDLLNAWVEASRQRKEKRKSYYIWAQNPQKLMQILHSELTRRGVRYAFAKEAGASMVAPFSTFDIVSLYIESLDKFPAESLSASEADKGFNVVLIEPRDEFIFKIAQKIGGTNVSDNLQLYIDLKKEALRGAKQAEHILNAIRSKLE